MDPSKQSQPSTSGTCGSVSSSNNSSGRTAITEPEIVPRMVDRVTRRPRQGRRIRQFAQGSHTPVPTTNEAVVLDWVPDIQLDSYIATVGNIVAPAHVRYASLVPPNRVCLFVSDAGMAQTLHGRTVLVEGHTLLIQPLIQPLARVLATNVYPMIEDQTIRAHLAVHHGVQVRDIVPLGADSQLPEYSHVLGFARHLYVPPEQLLVVPNRITGRQGDWPYLIYLGSEEQRCSSCHQVGHLTRYCAVDQRFIGVYGASTIDRRSSISSGSSGNMMPSEEGLPAYSETDAIVASSSVPIEPRGAPPSLGQLPSQIVVQSEPSTSTNANVTSPPIQTVPIGGQSSREGTPGKKKQNSSPSAEALAISTSPRTPSRSKGVLPSLDRTPGKQNQKSSPLAEALAQILSSPKTPNRPKGVVLPSLKQSPGQQKQNSSPVAEALANLTRPKTSSHELKGVLPSLKRSPAQRALNLTPCASSPQSKQVKNTVNPSPLADPSAPQAGPSTEHSSCPFVAAIMGSPASESSIAVGPPADPSPSTPSNAAAAAATQSTSAGTSNETIDYIPTSLIRTPPSSGTRSLIRMADVSPSSGEGQQLPVEARQRPATPRRSRSINRPRSRRAHGSIIASAVAEHAVQVDRRTAAVPTRWIYREQDEEEEEERQQLQLPNEQASASGSSDGAE